MQVLLLLFGSLARFCLGTCRTGARFSLLPNHLLNVFLEVGGFCGGWETLDNGAVARDEELGEVPLDVTLFFHALADGLEQRRRGLGLQPLVLFGRGLRLQVFIDGVRFRTVNVDFLHQREGHAVVEAAELGNLLVGAGFLMGELVAGEAEDDQPLVSILLVKGFQSVVLRGETALGGGVDNHEDLAAVLRHFHLCALVVLGFEIVNCSHNFENWFENWFEGCKGTIFYFNYGSFAKKWRMLLERMWPWRGITHTVQQSFSKPNGKNIVTPFDHPAVASFRMRPHPFWHGLDQPHCLRIKVRVYGNDYFGIRNGAVHLHDKFQQNDTTISVKIA